MKTFSDLTNEQLDTIYYNTIGYRPIAEDGEDRETVISILTDWKAETGEDVKGMYSVIQYAWIRGFSLFTVENIPHT